MMNLYILGVALTIIVAICTQMDKVYQEMYIKKVKSVTIAMGFDEDNAAVNNLICVLDIAFTSLFSFIGLAVVIYDYLSVKNKKSK